MKNNKKLEAIANGKGISLIEPSQVIDRSLSKTREVFIRKKLQPINNELDNINDSVESIKFEIDECIAHINDRKSGCENKDTLKLLDQVFEYQQQLTKIVMELKKIIGEK